MNASSQKKGEKRLNASQEAWRILLDKDIPPPLPRAGGRDNFKYPWKEMEINDSFFVEGRTAKNMYTQVREASKRHKKGFIVRDWKKDGVEGVRVWRIS